MNSTKIAPLFIMLAATLWAVDAIFRTQLTYTIPPASIVLFEHFIGFLFLSPLFFKNLTAIKKLQSTDWLLLIGLTVVSSVLGTILFTEALGRSFANNDFVTPILLQKLQPVFVVLLSAFILKERITNRFIALAAIALVGSYLLSFGTSAIQLQFVGKELVFLLALGAAASWGSGTIMSKYALKKLSFPALTSLRFLLAVPVAFLFTLFLGQTYDYTALQQAQLWRFIIIAGITGGALAIYLYYKGLQNTPARISTFAELMLPVASIVIAVTPLNPYGAPQTLSLANIAGIILLVSSITLMSLLTHKTSESTYEKTAPAHIQS